MTVEVGKGVIYEFYDAKEEPLEQVASWTDAAQKIREITDDVLRLAIAGAPIGRARDDQMETIQFSHRKGAPAFAGRYKYRQAVINTARHAAWVHMGTGGGGDRRGTKGLVDPVTADWMGPVGIGNGKGQVGLAPGDKLGTPRESLHTGAAWTAFPSFVMFHQYLWRGQEPQPWLAEAGQAAYRLPRNH